MKRKNKIVRDIEASIKSPFLLNDEKQLPIDFLSIDNDVLEIWLTKLDNNPAELIEFTERYKTRRLGRYFENLLHFYFLFHPNIKVLEMGRQIFDGKRTIGEMDFVLKNKSTKEIVHIETALKYFAKEKYKSDFYSFICPSGERTFGDKLDKTFNKQLKITELPQTKAYLGKANLLPLKSYHYIKGTLFYHPSELKDFTHPNLNCQHKKGWWILENEVDTLSDLSKFKITHKLKWLSEEVFVKGTNEVGLMAKKELISELKTHFEIISQGQLIVEFIEKENLWVENSRGFVLGNNWPNM